MALYLDENDYPQNYDWLSQEKQQAIIDMMNDHYERRLHMFSLARSKGTTVDNHRDFIERQWYNMCEQEDGMMLLLESLGIKLEYDWVGHRGTYFLATYDDALAQQDYYDELARDVEGDVDLCYAGGDYKNE